MGTLFKRHGVYYMRLKDRRGKWIQRSTGTTYKKPAEKKLEDAEKKMVCGEDKLLSAFLQEYLDSLRASLGPGGRVRYQFCVDILTHDRSPLAAVTLQELDRAAVTSFVNWRLEHGRAKATVAKEVAWLKTALDEAAELGHIAWERAYQLRVKKWRQLKGEHKEGVVLLPHQWDALSHAANPNLRDAMIVALWTGLRQGNILSLTEGQVDFSSDVLTVSAADMKAKRGLKLRLPPRVRAVLWERWTGTPTRRFFVDFRPCWKRLKKKLEADGTLTGFRFHDFRRSYVSYRLVAGIDPKTVQAEVAHRTSKMTMDVYGEAVKEAAAVQWGRDDFRFAWDHAANVQHAPPKNALVTAQDRDGAGLPE